MTITNRNGLHMWVMFDPKDEPALSTPLWICFSCWEVREGRYWPGHVGCEGDSVIKGDE